MRNRAVALQAHNDSKKALGFLDGNPFWHHCRHRLWCLDLSVPSIVRNLVFATERVAKMVKGVGLKT